MPTIILAAALTDFWVPISIFIRTWLFVSSRFEHLRNWQNRMTDFGFAKPIYSMRFRLLGSMVMRLRSMLLMAAAATCAGIATLLTTLKSPTAPQQVKAPAPKVVEKLVPADTKTIVVARKNLPFGTKLDQSMLQEVAWPSKLLPAGAFSKLDNLVGQNGTSGARVVLRPMTKGEPVLKSKVSKPGHRPSLAGALGGAKSAVTIRVDDVQGVAGFIQPDDNVDVLLTRKLLNSAAGRTAKAEVFTDVLLQNVKVLAVDQRLNRNNSAKPARAVTLEVDQVQAQKLVLASSVGKLSLTLKNMQTGSSDAPRRVSLSDLPGSKPAAQQTAPSAAAATVVEDSKPSLPQVSIVRGTGKRQVYEVLEERSSVRVLRRSYVTAPEEADDRQPQSSDTVRPTPESSAQSVNRAPFNPISVNEGQRVRSGPNSTIELPQ